MQAGGLHHFLVYPESARYSPAVIVSAACRILAKCCSKRGAMVRPEFEDSEAPSGKILLVPQIFVADDQQFEAGRFSDAKQFAIFEFAPAHLRSGVNLMRR